MTSSTATKSTPVFLLNDKTYNVFKLGAQLVLPAVAALYYALATVWSLPAPEKVTGSVAALNVFLGVLVTFSKMLHEASGAQYGGTVAIEDTDEGSTLSFQNIDPVTLDTKDQITFKIVRH